MKRKLIRKLSLLYLVLVMTNNLTAQVTIGANSSPAPYSILEVVSTTTAPGGMRIPQVASLAERNAIQAQLTADPTTNGNGLTIYYLPNQEQQYWNGSNWMSLVTGAANGLTKNGTNIELGGTMTQGKTITLAVGRPLIFRGDASNPDSNTNIEISGRKALKINDGNQASGKVLVSDSYGNTTWQTPTTELNIVGPMRYNNGTAPFAGKVLMADGNGVASWQNQGASPTAVATIGDGVTFNPYTETNTGGSYITDALWRDTGSRINIPPGKWLVMVTTLVTITLVDANLNNTSSMWVRSSFRRAGNIGVTGGDFVGTYLISGTIRPNAQWQMLTGYVIINNTSANAINYEYIVGNTNTFQSGATTPTSNRWPQDITINRFGGNNAGENSIVAFALAQ